MRHHLIYISIVFYDLFSFNSLELQTFTIMSNQRDAPVPKYDVLSHHDPMMMVTPRDDVQITEMLQKILALETQVTNYNNNILNIILRYEITLI